MRFRFLVSAAVVALLAAGCFSTGSNLVQKPVTLYSHSELTADGPAFQYVTVEATAREGESVDFQGLQVRGRTGDGELVEVDWVVPSFAAEEGEDLVADGNTFTFGVDVADLVERGIVALEVILADSVLQVPIRQGAGEGAGAGEGEAAEAPMDEAEALEVDAGLDYFEVPDDVDLDDISLDAGGALNPYWGPAAGDWLDEEGDEEGPVSAQATATVTRQVRTLRAGTSQATQVYIIRSSRPGPTVMIVGGVHGSETAGWRAAEEIKNWRIDRGTLIVLPQANRPAILRNRRTGADGIDLNRQFPVGSTPRTALAREIWNVVRQYRPSVLMDLHEGWGIRRLGHRFPGGTLSVGQTLITYPAKDARSFATYATRYVDRYYVTGGRNYSFMVIGPPTAGSLARKAGAELGIPAFIVEPTQHLTTVATRVLWHKAFVQELLKWYGLVDKNRTLVPRLRAAAFDAGGDGMERETFLFRAVA